MRKRLSELMESGIGGHPLDLIEKGARVCLEFEGETDMTSCVYIGRYTEPDGGGTYVAVHDDTEDLCNGYLSVYSWEYIKAIHDVSGLDEDEGE